ncbi:MAG: SPOR domain-containing protein [Candidatus Polarisedimenticolaceae bacterium]|nr:SPOR domain-containing protein [Candidatus Polarisedimenticolaceae bacterium]
MARDYKTRANPKPKKQQSSGWIWFFAGLLVGLFTAGLLWLKFGSQQTVAVKPAHAPAHQEAESQASVSLPPKPRFDFYTTLPEMEVVVPEPDPIPRQPPQKAAPVTTGSAYMLQMGSFRKYRDADRMKAGLALLGIQAEIQKVTINNKETYHRVRSGPYRTGQQVNQIRDQLRKNKINSLLIKLKR